jgi:hypothetical protein
VRTGPEDLHQRSACSEAEARAFAVPDFDEKEIYEYGRADQAVYAEPVSPRTDIILSPVPSVLPGSLFAPTPKAAQRVLEFFTTQINNDHTRKSYLNATRRFAEWCELHTACTSSPTYNPSTSPPS